MENVELTKEIEELNFRISQLEKDNIFLKITVQVLLNLLIKKMILKKDNCDEEFDKVKYRLMGFEFMKTGDTIKETDAIFCTIWWEDLKEVKDLRSYINFPLTLTKEHFPDFEELLTLIGQRLHLGKIYEIERKIPDVYEKNPDIAGKTLIYKVKITKCLERIKNE